MESPRRDPGRDVHDRRVLVAVLGVPSPGLEIDLVHHLRVEQLVQAAGDARWHGKAVHVVGVFGVLAADMDFAGRRPRRAHDRLLQDLGCRVGRSAVVIVLLEDLVAAAGVDGERDGGSDLHRLEVDRNGREPEIHRLARRGHRHLPAAGTIPEVAHLDRVGLGRQVVDHVAAERVGGRHRDDGAAPRDADFPARQRLSGGAVRHRAGDVAIGGSGRGVDRRREQRE